MPPDVSLAGTHHNRESTIEELKQELAEARDQRAATGEILRIISSSPSDLQPVLDTIVATATRLCGAEKATIRRRSGDAYQMVAEHGCSPEQRAYMEKNPVAAGPGTIVGRAAETRKPVYVADVEAYPGFTQMDLARGAGFRAALAMPLLREGEIIGVLMLLHSKPNPFTADHIERAQTFADQAVIAIENTRLFEEVQARTRELTESLEQQTATSEVLGVITRSPGELEPVFQAILASATHLCGSNFGTLFQSEGDGFRSVALHNPPAMYAELRGRDPIIHPSPMTAFGRAVATKQPVQVADVQSEPAYVDVPPGFTAPQIPLLAGARTALAVPMLNEDEVVGAIIMNRQEVRPFTEKQIELVSNFAKQAVIAIESVRLLNELRESLQQQTATADVLKVISRSTFDLQTVLDALVQSAAGLCEAEQNVIFLRDGNIYRIAARYGMPPELEEYAKQNPIFPGRNTVTGRVALECRVVHIPDVLADPEYTYGAQPLGGYRALLGVPLLREGSCIGVMAITRTTPQPFTAKQIELVTTFADQAVIAIENTRLFEEVQARTKELQDSLDRQTATSEVLGVISRSPNEVQPVLDTIVATAQRLCQAERAAIWRLENETFRAVAHHGLPEERVEPLYSARIPLSRGTMLGRATLMRRAVQVEDVATDPELVAAAHAFGRAGNINTVLAVPLLLKGHHPIGVIALTRTRVARFDDKQVALVEAFADQAVIAIENSRLFEAEQASKRELTESLEQQTATADVLKVISRSALDVQKVLDALVESAARLCDAYDATIGQVVDDGLRLVAHHGQIPTTRPVGQLSFPLVRGRIGGRAVIDRRTIQVADALAEADEYPEGQKTAVQVGCRTALAVPLVHAGEAIGVIVIRRTEVRPFTERQIDLVNTFADQAVIAIENARLFEEVQARTRELAKTVEDLEIASQHKNQFVANMSHELRTPLAAILGYAELIQEGFYEPPGPKSLDALTRIRSNGKHLLGLINTVLDIAKIESGQFTLNMAEYAIESVVETVRSATESLAQNKKLALKTEVAKSLPIGLGDEQRLTQVLLNLVGNAIKFTDTGEVRVTAKSVNGHFAITVADTGPGILEQERTRIFDQFHQVDSSLTKAKGGTGLGLAIAKQIVEMHGGRIWVESTVGEGSTFQMEIPTRAEFRKRAL